MKRLLLAVLILTSCGNYVYAREKLRTSEYIEIENGDVITSGVLGNSDADMFIEFPKTIRVTHDIDKTLFDGDILPPEIILLDAKAPRARMRKITAFEILGTDGESLNFLDRVVLMDDKKKIKKSYNDPEFEITNSQVRIFFMVPYEPETRNLALWEYLENEDKWLPFGGKTEVTDEGQKLFTSAILGTGVFAIFDENPPPSFIAPHPIDQIDSVDETDLTTIDQDEIKPYVPEEEKIDADEVHVIYAVNDLTSGNEVIPAIDETSSTDFEFEDNTENNTTNTSDNENLPEGLIVPAIKEETTDNISLLEDEAEDSLPDTEENTTTLPIDGTLPATGADEEKGFSFPFGIVFALGILGLGTFFIMREERY